MTYKYFVLYEYSYKINERVGDSTFNIGGIELKSYGEEKTFNGRNSEIINLDDYFMSLDNTEALRALENYIAETSIKSKNPDAKDISLIILSLSKL